jgi:hypothetical protein
MEKEPVDPAEHFGNLVAAYTDSIRVSDFKANLAVLFAAIMMGPIVAYRDKYPHFLPLPLILLPFMVVFFFLLICVYPRYPRKGRNNFLVAPNPSKSDFLFVDGADDDAVQQLKLRCSILSGILFWKTLCLQISFTISLLTIAIIFFLLSHAWL